MKKVDLRMNELEKYKTIKKLVETNGNKKRVAVKLNCSIRTVNRLIIKYKECGKSGFIHGNRNRKPPTTYSDDIKNKIISYYKDEYYDTNIVHFSEIVKDDFDINISPRTILNWLKDIDILSPKAKRKTKRELDKKLKGLLQEESSNKEKNILKEKIDTLNESEVHTRRPRKKNEGEMIQMDASSFEWIKGCIWHLHVAIDDASGKIVGAYFDTQETLNGYYNVLYQILTNYGIPFMFYTDRRTVFEYNKKESPFDHEDTYTQFAYACKRLGTQIKCTSIAQSKGRVERLNSTLQSRLPIDLRRANIKTITEANTFLTSYIKKFNDQFALQLNNTRNVYEKQPSKEDINLILAIIDERKIDNGCNIKYKNNYYIPVNNEGKEFYFNKGTECLVINSFDNKLFVSIKDNTYGLKQVEKHEIYSEEFDIAPVKKEKKPYIPPMDHPWRRDSWNRFKNTQKHRQNGANV